MRATYKSKEEYYRYRRGLASYIGPLVRYRVLTGPFKGMWISSKPVWEDGNLCTKYLGVYEHELHGVISEIIKKGYKSIINIGCAEGYYAVGLAMRCPQAQVTACDIDEGSLVLCNTIAKRNFVDTRITTKNVTNEFVKIPDDSLLMLDCEGAELDILNQASIPELEHCDILVECHDFLKSGTTDELIQRFNHTHEIQVIEPQLTKKMYVQDVSFGTALEMITEVRPEGTKWLWMQRM